MSVSILVTNPLKTYYKDALVEIDIENLFKDCYSSTFDGFVLINDTICPFQLNDNPGMAIFYNSGNLIEFSEDEESMVIKFKLDNKEINYNFATAWEKEKDGIKNIDEFRKCLETMTVMLNNTLLLKLLWAGIL